MRQQILHKDYKIFKFTYRRNQTQYRQENYEKISYITQNDVHVEYLTLSDMLEIESKLREIGFETTRQKFFSKEQRRLMTKDLRKKIMNRDNYTCQICGKYMPDEVGLHVDHIVAVKNGGKTVESNLQVLCSKCNLHKSSSY